MQEHAAEEACAKHSSSMERLTRETSADVESDHSPTWEAASVPDAAALGSRRVMAVHQVSERTLQQTVEHAFLAT